MRIIAGVDWSDESFSSVEQIGLLYRPDDVVLVHESSSVANSSLSLLLVGGCDFMLT